MVCCTDLFYHLYVTEWVPFLWPIFCSFQVQVSRENARGRDDKASGVPEGVHGRAAYSSCPNHCSLARLWANSIHHPTRSHQCKHELVVALLLPHFKHDESLFRWGGHRWSITSTVLRQVQLRIGRLYTCAVGWTKASSYDNKSGLVCFCRSIKSRTASRSSSYWSCCARSSPRKGVPPSLPLSKNLALRTVSWSSSLPTINNKPRTTSSGSLQREICQKWLLSGTR